jgi:hypothetical protein
MPTALELLYEGNYVCTQRTNRMPNAGDLFEYKGNLYYVHSGTDMVCQLSSAMWAWC